MQRGRIDAKDDHVLRLAKLGDPAGALAELIWNSFDADATLIEVEIETDIHSDKIETVQVRDNGHGMPHASCESYFRGLGGSWKATARTSQDLKRVMNGRNGQGRVRGFALGDNISWTTVAQGTAQRERTVVRLRKSDPTGWEIDGPEKVGDQVGTGTIFRSDVPAAQVNRLDGEKTVSYLTATFAPYLMANTDVTIEYRGVPLDPADAYNNAADYSLAQFKADDGSSPLLKLVEWPTDPGRELALCDVRGTTLATLPPGVRIPGVHFTAYIVWDEFVAHADSLLLGEFDHEFVMPILDAAREQIAAHFEQRADERRRELVAKWKLDKVYPYMAEPADAVEAAEREIFEQVAFAVANKLPVPTKPKRATLRLLREVCAQDPDRLIPVMDEAFNLTKGQKESLVKLVQRTPFANLIAASTDVAGRLDFLAALRMMVFDPRTKKHILERSELHKYLERELWIFGEQFNLLVSDQSLDEVLDRHLGRLGKARKERTPVRRSDNRSGIVDLMLSKAGRSGSGREHLVVELKAPKVTIGAKEATQIESYAFAVANDAQFKDASARWDFWIIGSELDPVIEARANQLGQPGGLLTAFADQNVWVWAKT